MSEIPDQIHQFLRKDALLTIQKASPLSGGCIHHAYRIATDKGIFFLKWNHQSAYANLVTEAQGLNLLASTHTLSTPEVVTIGKTEKYAVLVLSFIHSSRPASNYWEQFGHQLANLHLHHADAFGLEDDNFIGALPQSNKQHEDFSSFFMEERIKPMVRLAKSKGLLSLEDEQQFERLYANMEDFFPEESPSLVHGDLWGGNMMVGPDGQVVIFDPSAHFTHREMELSFMTLFDRQPEAFYAAYNDVYPIAPGFEERIPLYQLYPLLVHVNLFGSSYMSGVQQILRSFA